MILQKKRKRRKSILVSTSDIAFLLLIFLVVTASLEYNAEITPPTLVNTTDFLYADTQTILIEITGSGELYVESKKIEFDNLASVLSEFDSDFNYKIFADGTTPFFLVTLVLEELQKSNKQKVLLMIEKETE